MARTVFDKLGADSRFQVAFGLLVVAASVVVGLVTESLGAGGLVLSVFGIVVGGAKALHEQSPLNR
jgi:hypothetical protein